MSCCKAPGVSSSADDRRVSASNEPDLPGGLGIEPPSARVAEALSAAEREFCEELWGGRPSDGMRRYLRKRGVAEVAARRFRIGCSAVAHDQLTVRLVEEGFPAEVLVEAGLSRYSSMKDQLYDRFRSRLMFPIRLDSDSAPIGFYGMAIHPGPSWPRWLVSPRRDHFDGTMAMFGLDQLVAKGGNPLEVIIFDDCLAAVNANSDGAAAVAIIRSSTTVRHQRLLEYFGAGRTIEESTSERIRRGSW